MTSNTDKLKLIAPLLAGRRVYLRHCDDTGTTYADGLFHSLEIDDVYPDSEPMAYIRATNVEHRREEGFPIYDAVVVSQYVEEFDEFVFPVDDLLSIKLVQDNKSDEDIVTVEFDKKNNWMSGYELIFVNKWPKR